MSVIDHVAFAARLAGADDGDATGPVTRRGWDFWKPGQPATDGMGNARTAHPAVLGHAAIPDKCLPIVDAEMNAQELQGGIWRQCLIRPGNPDAMPSANPFAVSDAHAYCSRGEHMVALVGHTPGDLAHYLDHLRQRDAALFRLVLAKDFRGAIAHHPEILLDPWPESMRHLWKEPAGDYLPPFLVAVLYAELARLANNQAGLIELSFDDGTYLSNTQFLKRVPLAGGPSAPIAIKRAVDMAPWQSIALTPPGGILEKRDQSAATAWSTTAASHMVLAAGIRNGLDAAPANPASAKFIRDGFAAHPGFWREARKGRGTSPQYRPSATYWGLNWRRHAATGLLEILTTARAWNERYRPNGPRLARFSRRSRAQAIGVISFGWLAEMNSAAALAVLKEVNKSVFGGWTSAQVTPLTRDHELGDKAGDDLLRSAEEELARRVAPGALGYTARYQAHLWLDDHGDDLEHYRHFQCRAMEEHEAALRGGLPCELRDESRVPRDVVELLGRQNGLTAKIGHNLPPTLTMTGAVEAALAARNLGMMISPLSADPILEVHLRKR